MSYVTAAFTMLVRLLRPTRGVHTSPLGYVRELAGEARRRRARRVRRYVQDLPALVEAEPAEEDVPVVPAPRRPVDEEFLPGPTSGERPTGSVNEPDVAVVAEDLVRSYYRAWEHQHRFLHRDHSRRSGPTMLVGSAKSGCAAGVRA